MVNFMGDIEKGRGNSLEKLKLLLESAPQLAMSAATTLVDTIIYEVQVRLDQGAVQPLAYNICLLAAFSSTRVGKPVSAVTLLTVSPGVP